MTLLDCTCGKSFFELFNDFIGHVIWPSLILLLILLFKKELSALLSRINSIEGAGLKASFGNELKDLNTKTEKASKEYAPLVDDKKSEMEMNQDLSRILLEYSKNNEIGIMLLSTQIEKETRSAIAAFNLYPLVENSPISKSFELLFQKKYISSDTLKAQRDFWAIRNKIIHGVPYPDKEQMASFLDTGLSLLKTLKAMERVRQKVVRANFTLYSDAKCTYPLKGVTGIIIQGVGTDGANRLPAILPTRKEFTEGSEVVWKISFDHVLGDTWYIDTTSGKPTLAWSSAAEFDGIEI